MCIYKKTKRNENGLNSGINLMEGVGGGEERCFSLTYIDDEICKVRASVIAAPDPIIQWHVVVRMK